MNKQKGGTLIGVHKSLSPILIEEYSEEFELLVVEIQLGGKDVRIISGYGPQENWRLEERAPFFSALEEEIVKAKTSDKAVYIQLDANSKLGPTFIQGDPHAQSDNGKILAGIIQRNAMCVVNSLKEKCVGKYTRQRSTKKRKEASIIIIDFVIGCEEMNDMITSLVIDEKKEHALASFRKTKNGSKVTESDHNSLITHIKAVWKKKQIKEGDEIYNLKNKMGIKQFKELTSKDEFLSSVFKEEGDIETQTKHFLKRLDYCIRKCFTKIRVTKNKRD